MRIREIISELTRPPTKLKAGKLLSQAGYKQIGGGLFATVWARPRDEFVLKLFTAQDTSYLKFVRLAQAMPNEHFPRFRGKPMRISDRYYAIRVERLKPPSLRLKPLMKKMFEYLGAHELLKIAKNNTSLGGKEKIKAINELVLQIRDFRIHYPSLANALDAIYKYVVEGDPTVMNDINMWNVWLRGDTLVFMDPVGSSSEYEDPEVDLSECPTQTDLENIEHDKAAKRKPDIRRKRFVAMPGNTSTYPAL